MNTLSDRIFTTNGGGVFTLPGVLAALGAGEDLEFPGLQPHQEHAFYAFLVQLAALVQAHGGLRTLRMSEAQWRTGLLALAGGRSAAWCLVVEDLAQPAFLQPPVGRSVPDAATLLEGFERELGALIITAEPAEPLTEKQHIRIRRLLNPREPAEPLTEKQRIHQRVQQQICEGPLRQGCDLQVFKRIASAPDEMDYLFTSKRWDLHPARIRHPRPEHWAYALISLQTMAPYGGRGNQGIARTGSGYGARIYAARVPDLHWPRRFARDVALWAGPPDGLPLLWLLPWDGKESVPASACDKRVVEVCRRVRLVEEGGVISGRCAAAGRRLQGALPPDIWTPVDGKGQHLPVGAAGFSYPLLADLFAGRWTCPALRAAPKEAPLLWLRVVAGGQCQTKGFHQRLLALPAPLERQLAEAVGPIARAMVEAAAIVQKQVLFPALSLLLGGMVSDAMEIYRQRADAAFVEQLGQSLDQGATGPWTRFLIEQAAQIVAQAGAVRAPAARAQAEGLLRGCANKQFPDLGA